MSRVKRAVSLPVLSGAGSWRLHSDQVRSRETASRRRESGEKAICVTVRLWHGRDCSCRQEEALQSRMDACSALVAWGEEREGREEEEKRDRGEGEESRGVRKNCM